MGRLLKLAEVMTLTGRPEVWIYRAEKSGRFPQRVRLGPNSVAWHEDELRAWMDGLPRGPRPSPVLAELARSEKAREGQRRRREREATEKASKRKGAA